MPRETISIEAAWNILFERHDIVNYIQEHGSFRITAAQINTVKEARLMARFDNSLSLPPIFRTNHLSILPVTRGEYLIGPYKTHQPIEYGDIEPQPVIIPNLETLDYTNLYSESSALLFAFNSGIIKDIMNSINNVNFTVNGRMGSGAFSFDIENITDATQISNITVQNSQIEIDGGYESEDIFCIFEAKNIEVREMIIRQLYYPYRLWKSKINKPVVPVFLVFSNDVFHAFVYRFNDDNNYNSIELVLHKSYTFENQPILRSEVDIILNTINLRTEPTDATFPQANSFERVVDLLSLLFENDLTKDEVTSKYVFAERQTDYYITACVYLGLVKRTFDEDGDRKYQLTTDAYTIMRKNVRDKNLSLIKRVLEFPVFNVAYRRTLESGNIPTVLEIYTIMATHGIHLADSTKERRASTVYRWVYWILSQYDE